MQEKEQKIIEHLKNKYSPAAILLHGSRAAGKERPHSDWDILMLFREAPARMKYREEVDEENVEWKACILPISTEEIISRCGLYLQFARVLWEGNNEGTDLLRRAALEYAKGPQLSEENRKRELLFLRHKLLGMQDDQETPYMFLRHSSVFFAQASDLCFQLLQNEYPKPFYLAIPEIRERDPEYARDLEALSSNIPNSEKVACGERILGRLS